MAETRRTFWILGIGAPVLLACFWCTILFPTPEFPYRFQCEIQTTVPTVAQLYYERGAGLRDSESAETAVASSRNFTPIDLPLPGGKYRSLHFFPTSGTSTVRFRNVRIVSFDGRVACTLSPTSFTTDSRTAQLSVQDQELEFLPKSNAIRPHVVVSFEPVLRLGVGFWSKLHLHAPRWLKIFGLSLATLVVVRAVWIRRRQLTSGWNWARDQRPRLALTIVASLATALSSYPVIFFGKSFLSPTSGSVLLYDRAPTLPGFTDLRQDKVHGSDVGAMMWQHLPYTVLQHRAFAAGEFPLWNRYSSTGNALLGQGQSMLGDPFHVPVIAAGGEAWAFDAKFIWAKFLFACGIGWCAWSLTRDFAASAVAILAGAFVGFFNYRFNHPAIFSVGYAPWILVGWFEIIRSETRRALLIGLLLWFATNFCVITSGTVKEAYVLGLALNCAGTGMLIFSSVTVRRKIRLLGFTCTLGAALILLTAPVWWTFFHTLKAAYTAYEVPTVLQIRREWFIGFFDDLFYRELMPQHTVYTPAANFLVLLGCFFAVARPVQLWRNSFARILALMTVAALGIAFQTGSTESSPQWLLKVPLVRNLYHVNNLFSCVALVLTCVLAGWGFARAREMLPRIQPSRYLAFAGAVFGLVFVPYFTFKPPGWTGHHWHPWSEADLHQRLVYVHVLLLPLALWMLVAAVKRRHQDARWTASTVTLAILALFVLLFRHGQHLPFVAPNDLLTTPGTRPHLFAPSAAVEFLRKRVAGEPARIIGTAASFFPGYASVYDLEGINAPDALVNRRHREIASSLGLLGDDWRMRISNDALPRWHQALDFLNVAYVATEPGALKSITDYRRVAELDLDIWHSEHAWPRAFFVGRLETYDTVDELARRISASGPSRLFAAIQLSDLNPELAALAEKTSSTASAIPAKHYRLQTNKTAFTIAAPSAGVAVLHEAWLADDFVAKLDGRVVPYLRVNHAFKGIVIPSAGVHQIEFEYWPLGLSRALVASVLGVALLAGGIYLVWRFEKEVSPSAEASAQG